MLRAEERLTAVWSNHLSELNQRVPAGFVVVVQPPFVVIGDESPGMVWSRATNTVKWAVDQLKQEYFQHDPVEITTVAAVYDPRDRCSQSAATTKSQEKGLLTKFYREFVANLKSDPTGFNTLKRVLGEQDMVAFQKKWEKFTLDLSESEDW